MSYKFYDLILKPVITEKSTVLSELRKYIFIVLPSASKLSVKKALENIFDVNIVKINIVNIYGKSKRFKGTLGKQADKKKAIVTLKQGQTIDFGVGGIK